MFHQIKIVTKFINPFERKAIVTNALINVTPQYDEGGGGGGWGATHGKLTQTASPW